MGPENYFIVIMNLLYIHVHVLSRKVDRKSKIPIIMALMRKLTWCSVVIYFTIHAKHISGKYNNIADAISGFQMKKFRHLAPNAKQEPTPCLTFRFKIKQRGRSIVGRSGKRTDSKEL